MTAHPTPIALMRPRLPEAEAINPYLQEIDSQRCYTNFGPLHERFTAALATHLKLDRLAQSLLKSDYGQYLLDILKHDY